MAKLPAQVADFLNAQRIAVAGVSRDARQPANLIYRKLKGMGREVFAINPNASEVEGDPCYQDLRAVPHRIEAVVIATPPNAASQVVRECADLGIRRVWFHRSFGDGSVSEEAVQACQRAGIDAIVGGCPLMYGEPVDFGHRCMRWLLKLGKRVPG
jgi:predicted CoA-binding protein